jgi:hypothetical protein
LKSNYTLNATIPDLKQRAEFCDRIAWSFMLMKKTTKTLEINVGCILKIHIITSLLRYNPYIMPFTHLK